jgi:hypothetical protein
VLIFLPKVGFDGMIEADQGSPLQAVIVLPDDFSVEAAGDLDGREVMVQAEVLLFNGGAVEMEGQSGGLFLGGEDKRGGVIGWRLGGLDDLRSGEIFEAVDVVGRF